MNKKKQKEAGGTGKPQIKQRRKRGRSTQELLGIRTFTRYGLETEEGELLFFQISPVNLAVLSKAAVEIKIRHLMMVLSAAPEIEMVCADAYECFDDNKIYLQNRYLEEAEPMVRELLRRTVNGVWNLFLSTAGIIRGSLDERMKLPRHETDRKLKKKIQEKKQAQGLRM